MNSHPGAQLIFHQKNYKELYQYTQPEVTTNFLLYTQWERIISISAKAIHRKKAVHITLIKLTPALPARGVCRVEKLIFYSDKKCKIRFQRKQQQQKQQQRNNTWTKVVCNYESPLRIFFRITSFSFLARKGKCELSLTHTLSHFSPHGFLFTLEVLHNTTTWPQKKECLCVCVCECARERK